MKQGGGTIEHSRRNKEFSKNLPNMLLSDIQKEEKELKKLRSNIKKNARYLHKHKITIDTGFL